MKNLGLILIAFAAGCGEYNFTPIPKCAANQALTGDGNALKCVDVGAPAGGGGTVDMKGAGGGDMAMSTFPPVPACGQGKCLTGDNAGQLSCIDVAATNTTIVQLQNDLTSLTNRVTALEKALNGASVGGAKFAGVTMKMTTGRIEAPGADPGIASAASFCAAEFGQGAHMCTVAEMYTSVVSGKLTSKDTVPRSWVYAPAWQTPTVVQSPPAPAAGLGDNCAGYTYESSHLGFSGVAVEWSQTPNPLINNVKANVLRWHGGQVQPNKAPGAACNQTLPIACCK